MAQILIIDDEILLGRSLARALAQRGHEAAAVGTAEEGLPLLDKLLPEIVLLDMQLPGLSGLEALKKIRETDSNILVIIVTAYGTIASAVEAMKLGAIDFLRKPLDTDEVAIAIERALAHARLARTVSFYQKREAERLSEEEFLGESSKAREVRDFIQKLSGLSVAKVSELPPVLILGETGTGKDLVARLLHYKSAFAAAPFIEVNCPTLPRGLEEGELFGYEKGAFTDARQSKRGLAEVAEGGTLFLNEIGELQLESQAKLLRLIEQKKLRHVGGLRDLSIGVRITAATNRNLEQAVKNGQFRQDLFFRMNHVTLTLPPLRERKEDILLLAEHFLQRISGQKAGREKLKKLGEAAKKALLSYTWPGNVRELRQLLERAALFTAGETIEPAELRLQAEAAATVTVGSNSEVKVDFGPDGIDIEEVEKRLIVSALEESSGNVSEAARKLKLTREALRYRVQKFGLKY
ncbi:MAG TPA: sigma-54 dependent transcriptional regulator [candidate division Zixibacteria bacterium]|nr:sigma-54 dependent transcriptional regulator [candidate division Zixibacteria bacterium]